MIPERSGGMRTLSGGFSGGSLPTLTRGFRSSGDKGLTAMSKDSNRKREIRGSK